ncbi:hypothetical protein GA707_17120 [Nostocoides sp. F2B08]|uniref:hypothetical protein n=1 Tax=Nostocoides sp. F2B08 TaxID=2653936 RepID=UPI001262E8F5|nr:hypothetical protein [Tetrasphaera sp. F2B08]KAB7741923.1 hypothetical protein GA707_17120 [Tetrasphaera sp. F2B08]
MTREVVLSGVRGRTHLVYAASFLRTLTDRVSVHYLSGPDFLGAKVTSDEVLTHLPEGVRLEMCSSADELPPRGPLTYIAVGAPGLRPLAAMRRAQLFRRIDVVVVDEGLGSYGDRRTRYAAYRRQGGHAVRSAVRAAAVDLGARTLTGTRWPLYLKDRDWAVFEPVGEEFRRALGPLDPTAADPRRAVFLSQPWVDLGLSSEDRYLAHVMRLATEQADLGRRLVVRPHPAEPPERYRDFATMVEVGPAELDPEVVGAGLVIGASSTALLNLAALHGTPVHRVRAPGTEHLEARLSADQRRLLSRYLPPVSPS